MPWPWTARYTAPPLSTMEEKFPPRPSPRAAAEMQRRQRGRNIAVMVTLAVLVVLFFAITLVKLSNS